MKLFVTTCALLLSSACVNTYQSARMLPKGKTNVTMGVTNARGLDDGGEFSDGSIDVPEAMVRHGVSDAMELGFRYSAITEGKSYQVDAKFSLVKDRAAISIPVGLAYGDDETCCKHIAPTFIWSTPAGKSELTGSAKVILMFEDDESETFLGATIGMRLSTDHASWAFHPELGVLINPGEDGQILTLGAAFSINL